MPARSISLVREERATVVSIENGQATVEFDRGEGCGSCGLCAGAGRKMRLTLDAVDGLAPGRKVVIAVDRTVSVGSLLVLFGLPLVGLIAGAVLGQAWPVFGLPPDACSVLFALALLAACVLVARRCERRAARSVPHPTIVRIESP